MRFERYIRPVVHSLSDFVENVSQVSTGYVRHVCSVCGLNLLDQRVVRFFTMEITEARFVRNPGPFDTEYSLDEVFSQLRVSVNPERPESGFEPAPCRSRADRSATELPRGKRHRITRTLLASNRNTDSLFLLNHLEANWQELADYFHVRSRVHVEGHG